MMAFASCILNEMIFEFVVNSLE